MNYITRSANGILVSGAKKRELSYGLKQYINILCEPYLKNVDSIQKVIKKKYHIKTSIPILINQDICFILSKSLRNQETVLLNVIGIINIETISGNRVKISYVNDVISVNISRSNLRKKIEIARKIIDDFYM